MVLVGCLQAHTKVPEGLPFGGTQTSLLPWLSWRAAGMEGGALITVGVEALGPKLTSLHPWGTSVSPPTTEETDARTGQPLAQVSPQAAWGSACPSIQHPQKPEG